MGGKRGCLGVCSDFHFSPSAYVKMLSLSLSQVLPLQILELSVCSGLKGGRGVEGGSLKRFPFLSICHTVAGLHSLTPFLMFPNFLSPFCSFRVSPFFLQPLFNLLKNSLKQHFRPEFSCQVDELHLTACSVLCVLNCFSLLPSFFSYHVITLTWFMQLYMCII